MISITTGTFGLDSTEAGSIFLSCGRRNDRMEAAGFYVIKDLPMVNFNGLEVKKEPEALPLSSTDG